MSTCLADSWNSFLPTLFSFSREFGCQRVKRVPLLHTDVRVGSCCSPCVWFDTADSALIWQLWWNNAWTESTLKKILSYFHTSFTCARRTFRIGLISIYASSPDLAHGNSSQHLPSALHMLCSKMYQSNPSNMLLFFFSGTENFHREWEDTNGTHNMLAHDFIDLFDLRLRTTSDCFGYEWHHAPVIRWMCVYCITRLLGTAFIDFSACNLSLCDSQI